MVFSVYDDKTSVKLVKLTRVIGVTVPVKFAYKSGPSSTHLLG